MRLKTLAGRVGKTTTIILAGNIGAGVVNLAVYVLF